MADVHALGQNRLKRTTEELLRDSLSFVTAERARGRSTEAVVILVSDDSDFWPRIEYNAKLTEIIVCLRVFESIVDRLIELHGAIGEFVLDHDCGGGEEDDA